MTNAEKDIRAYVLLIKADAFIYSWGVISEAMGDSCDSVMCCIDLAADVFPGCVHSEVGVEGKA